MADRRRQIELLLGSLYDGLYLPGGSLRTDRGLSPGEHLACPTCGHTPHPGWNLDNFKRRTPCPTCGGRPADEHHRAKAGRGVVAIDPMDATRTPIGSEQTHATARPARTVRCDACNGEGAHGNGRRCQRCDGTGKRPLHVFDLQLNTRGEGTNDPLAAAIDARDQSGSYHQLELAHRGIVIHANKPAPFRVLAGQTARVAHDEIWKCFVLKTADIDDLQAWERVAVDIGFAYIDSRMPDPIVVPRHVRDNARELERHRARVKGRGTSPQALQRRDDEIRRLHRRGVPVQRLAFEHGLSVRQVYEVLNSERAA